MPESLERTAKMEELIECLIKMIGRNNQKIDELTKQVRQIEQSLLESVHTEIPFPREGYSFIANAKQQTPQTYR